MSVLQATLCSTETCITFWCAYRHVTPEYSSQPLNKAAVNLIACSCSAHSRQVAALCSYGTSAYAAACHLSLTCSPRLACLIFISSAAASQRLCSAAPKQTQLRVLCGLRSFSNVFLCCISGLLEAAAPFPTTSRATAAPPCCCPLRVA